ncbi:hypothetical protein KC338_g6556 [Hortaea werneckii]|uniref:U3 small nucleolar RNA-associated protein 6 N-terminal domain-containing protein n=1 Tax=Hortaea werneckii TaxID=91943 RepID=A0A3M7GTK8_HORWE|nr:hypothetical protein KC323_g7158 [Hortaea werneckii]KAI6861589.1 hypothetical protein KC338_g6556 [Hortaea werneckii]KAI7347892.1 hypothetical protein KC320_g6968 [Hortaea werneckii]RMZ04067.1 hypothetical protein D0862_05444 [Hortaea werneckii]
MAGASDKARFYLEQYVPELQEYERKQIFTREEISAIASKRSDFEHILNARGSKPADYARYATYEINLDSLRKKRCKRLGIKGVKGYSGQRTVFFILDRGTKKFPGDMGLWMQYIQFCQKEKANKKLAKVFTSVLRLKPRDWGLWVLAAKWYAEQQGDMTTARSYMQRGLRFCKDKKELWLEYCKLEMVYLAKLAARRKILGLDEERKIQEEIQEDDNMISLPAVTAADFEPDASKGVEEVNEGALKRLENAPALTGAIPLAIFDASMNEFKNNPDIAEAFFDLALTFDAVPSTPKVLQHILTRLRETASDSAALVICEARLHLLGVDATSPSFPAALGKTLGAIKTGQASLPEKSKPALAEKTVAMLLPYLEKQDEMDEDVKTVLVASINRYVRGAAAAHLRLKSKTVKALVEAISAQGKLSGEEISQIDHDIRAAK